MARADDLTDLFAVPESPLGFRQGVLTAYDPASGSNTVEVGGGFVTDLPILNTSDVTSLAAGDVVALLRFRTSWFILGRIAVPGSDAFGSAAVGFDNHIESLTDFDLTATRTTKASLSFTLPTWASEALVVATGHVLVVNTSGALGSFAAQIQMDDDIAANDPTLDPAQETAVPDGSIGALTAAGNQLFFDHPGGSVLTVALNVGSYPGPWTSHPNNRATISAFAIYRKG